MDISEMKADIVKFTKDRGWDKHQPAKELAIKLVLEATEVLDLFEYLTKEQVDEILKEEKFKEALGEEFGDVLRILLQLSHKCDIDLMEAYDNKRRADEKRFPLERSQNFDPVAWKLKKIAKHEKMSL